MIKLVHAFLSRCGHFKETFLLILTLKYSTLTNTKLEWIQQYSFISIYINIILHI